MPRFERTLVLRCPIRRVWEFLCRPANVVAVSPPELHMRLLEGPEVLSLGARIVVQMRRWGITQRLASEVTALVPESLLVDEQREGPFSKFAHTHRLEPVAEGTRMVDQIDFEAPGGLLGLVVTAASIQSDLEWAFDCRSKKFRELLEGSAEPPAL